MPKSRSGQLFDHLAQLRVTPFLLRRRPLNFASVKPALPSQGTQNEQLFPVVDFREGCVGRPPFGTVETPASGGAGLAYRVTRF